MQWIEGESTINGKIIKVVGLGDPDYSNMLMLNVSSNGQVEFSSGLSLDILLLLEFALNFSHIAIKGDGWPEHLSNGTWTGISRQVLEHEADLSITQTAYVDIRVQDFSFLIPTSTGHLVASFRQPNSLKNLVTASFTPYLWGALLFSAVLIMFSIKAMKFIRTRFNRWDDISSIGDSLHYDEAIYWVLATFCQQSFVGSPKSTPLRIIFISLTITSLVAFTAFSATLMSTLSIEIVPIKSFDDLVKSKLDVYGDSSAPFTHRFVQTMVDIRRKLVGNDKVKSTGRYTNLHDGLRHTLLEPAAYVTFGGVASLAYRKMGLRDDVLCSKFSEFIVPGGTMASGMFVRKGSLLRQIFNTRFASLHQYGFIKRLRLKWQSDESPKCGDKIVTFHSTEPMDITIVQTPIVVLTGGLAISILILSLEFNFPWVVMTSNTIQSLLNLKSFVEFLRINK